MELITVHRTDKALYSSTRQKGSTVVVGQRPSARTAGGTGGQTHGATWTHILIAMVATSLDTATTASDRAQNSKVDAMTVVPVVSMTAGGDLDQ